MLLENGFPGKNSPMVTKPRKLACIGALFLLSFAARAAEPVLLVARPEGPQSSAWLGAAIEAHVHFRLEANDNLTVVPLAVLRERIDAYADFSKALTEKDYRRIRSSYDVTHMVTQNFALSEDGTKVQLYAELVAAKGDEFIDEQDISFPRASLSFQLDSIVQWVQGKLEAKPASSLNAFYRTQLTPGNSEVQTFMGERLISAARAGADDAASLANDFVTVVRQDARAGLARYYAGVLFANAGAYGKAVEQLTTVVEFAPAVPGVYAPLCKSLRMTGSYEKALTLIAEAEKRSADHPELYVEKAMALAAAGKTSEAAGAFEKVLAHDKDNVRALVFFARRDNAKKSYSSALSYAQRALKIEEANGQALLAKAVALAALGRTGGAIDAYTKTAEVLADDPAPLEALGDLYSIKKDYAAAASSYKRAIALAPNSRALYLKAADALEAAGKKAEALATLRKAEPSNRGDAGLQSRIGLLAFALKDTITAYEHLKRYAAIERKNGPALKALGDIYITKKDLDRAANMLEEALPRIPEKTPVHMSLGRVYLAKQNASSALAYFKKVLAADRDYPDANRLCAEAYLLADDKKNALAYYVAERKYHPGQLAVQRQIAKLAAETGSRSMAARELETLVEKDTANGDALLQLAVLKLEAKQITEGDAYLKRALIHVSPDRETFMRLGDAFSVAKKHERAAAMYERALQQDLQFEQGWLKLAAAQLAAGADSAAAQSYLNLFGIDSDKYKGKLAKAGHLLLESGLKYKARQTYQLFLDKNYTDAEVTFNLARIEFGDGQYEKTVDLLDDIGGKYKSSQDVARMIAMSYARLKKYTKAIPALESVLRTAPEDREVVQLAAESYEQTREYKNAAAMYSRLVPLAKKNERPEIAHRVGLLYEKDNNAGRAIARYAQNVKEYPDDIRNYERLGALHFERKEYSKAIDALEPAVEMEGASGALVRMLAQAYDAQGDRENAARQYAEYLKKAPNDSLAWLELGTIHFEKKAYEQAAQALDQACTLMPRRLDCRLKLGISYKEIGLAGEQDAALSKAVNALSAARELARRDTTILSHLAECYRALDDSRHLIITLQAWGAIDRKNDAVLLELGELLIAENKLDEAVKALEDASKVRPKDVALHLKLAEAYGKLGDRKSRYAHLQSALAHDAKNPDIFLALARYHVNENQNEKARDYFKKAIAYQPDHALAQFEYGDLLRTMNKKQLAYKHFRLAVKADTKKPRYAYELSRLAAELGKNDEALKLAGRAAQLEADNILYISWTGYLYMQQGQNGDARKTLEKALAIDKNCTICYSLLGDISYAEGAYPAAIEEYKAALSIGGFNDTMSLKLGRAYFMNRQYRDATNVFEETFKQNRENHEALYWLVHAYIIADKEGKARRSLGKYRGRGKKPAWIQLAEGELYEMEGDLNAAYISYSTVSRAMPDIAQAYAGMGRVYVARKDYPAAIIQFGQAMAKEPNNVEFYLEMGQAYEATKEYASALAIYKEVLEKDPANTDAYYYLARIYSKQEKHAQAVNAIKTGLDLDTENARLYYALGHEYRLSNRPKDAIKAYETAARKDPKELYEAWRYMGLIYYHLLIDNSNALKSFKKYMKAGGDDPEVSKLIAKIQGK